tara:strand:- start:9352 stop:9609 length:258 start_codon:yes stop_codon:yes gene_type:complete
MAKPKEVGKVIHYYGNISVAVIKVATAFSKGDTILIGKNDNFRKQKVISMQRNQIRILKTRKGHQIGLKVRRKARFGDKVFKVMD